MKKVGGITAKEGIKDDSQHKGKDHANMNRVALVTTDLGGLELLPTRLLRWLK